MQELGNKQVTISSKYESILASSGVEEEQDNSLAKVRAVAKVNWVSKLNPPYFDVKGTKASSNSFHNNLFGSSGNLWLAEGILA